MIQLDEIYEVPAALLEIKDTKALHTVLPNPTLLYLEGHHKAPLFVTVLLHGNEDTGLFAIQRILRKYQTHPLPRSLIVFFGNVSAARVGMRRLDGQPDYNRIWPLGTEADTAEGKMVAKVVTKVVAHKPFASIDIHNNTGKNPYYGCVNALDADSLYLASLFARTVVYFETPKGVQSMAMAAHCPAVTVECGKPHLEQGFAHAAEFVDSMLHLSAFPQHTIHQESTVYHTTARVTIPDAYSFGFDREGVEIRLLPELEKDNFSELPAGTVFAYIAEGSEARFHAFDDKGLDHFERYFVVEGNKIKLKKPIMPSMITLDERVIRQDCLCYFMESIIPQQQEHGGFDYRLSSY